MKSPKKVVIIGSAYPLRGGIANFNEAFSKALSSNSISNNIYSFSLQYPSFLFPGTTQYDTGVAPNGITIKTVINSINPFSWISTAIKIKKENPDLIVVRYWLPFMAPCLGTILRIINFNKSIPVIAITDNVIPHEKRIGDRLLTSYFIKACNGYIAMSNAVLEELSDFTKSRNKVLLPHPIYNIYGDAVSKTTARQQLKLQENDRIILFFGFIRKYKGLELLLKAMANEQVKNLNIKLVVAGEFYEEEEHYHQLIKELSIQSAVLLHTHYIDSKDVKYYFSAADIIVQPYLTASQSGVTQIAYHFDKPMLVTNVGGLPEMVPHNKVGYVVDINENVVATALVDFYSNNREREFITNVKQEKQKYSWSYFVDGLINLYNKL